MHWLTQSGVGAAPGRGGVDSASPSPSTAGKSLNIINISRLYQILIRVMVDLPGEDVGEAVHVAGSDIGRGPQHLEVH